MAATQHRMRGFVHDINGLMSLAQLSADQLCDHQDMRVAKRAGRISQAIDEVVEICRSELQDVTSTKVQTTLTSSDVQQLLQRISTVISGSGLGGESCFTIYVRVEPNFEIRCHDQSLFRIIFNLCINAARAVSASGGTSVDLAAEVVGDGVRFTIDDDGPGLPPHVLAFLYPSLDQQTRPKGRIGSGLITAIALASEIGGDLNLEDSSQNGTCFSLTLPFGAS